MDVRTIRKQVREYDWAGLVKDAKVNALEIAETYDPDKWCEDESIETDDTGKVTQVVGSAYMGSVLSLSPSGKYYTPWANSNVDSCPRCGGSGEGKPMQCPTCRGFGTRAVSDLAKIRHETDAETVVFLHQTRPENMIYGDVVFLCWTCNGAGTVHETCSHCGGLGSREAYEDQVWSEALDKCATRYGGSVESGEGDPTDLFFRLWVNVKAETAKQTVKRFVKRGASFGELKAASRDL